MKIDIQHKGEFMNVLFAYESDIAPLIGDMYAGVHFKDNQQRVITGRLLFPTVPDAILVYVDYAFPNLLPKKTEMQEHLS